MAHPLLKGSHRHASRGQRGSVGVAKVVEAHVPEARGSERFLEVLPDRCVDKDFAGFGMTEDQIVVALELGALEMRLKLHSQT